MCSGNRVRLAPLRSVSLRSPSLVALYIDTYTQTYRDNEYGAQDTGRGGPTQDSEELYVHVCVCVYVSVCIYTCTEETGSTHTALKTRCCMRALACAPHAKHSAI